MLAHDQSHPHEIQFWGRVDLVADPAEELQRLRAENYPLVFVDLPTQLTAGRLEATPRQWRVTVPALRVGDG